MPSQHAADWMFILVCAPHQPEEKAGILLLDRMSDRLHIRLKPSLSQTDEAIREIWKELTADLESKALELSGEEIVQWLEVTASNTFRISERKTIQAADMKKALEQLFADRVS